MHWRQIDLAERAGLSRDVVSRIENGELDGLTLRSLDAIAQSVGANLVTEIRWRGADLDRLIDRAHAALGVVASERLMRAGWIVSTEVAFNHYGDRGSCDLVAWHQRTQTLLVTELKARMGNLQETIRSIDVKARLGSLLAEQLGYSRPAHIGRALVLSDSRTSRRLLAVHEPLFGAFPARGRTALRWLRHPDTATRGLIWFEQPADSDASRIIRNERARHRRPEGPEPH